MYSKQVFPQIDTFYLTDKMDGVRAMLIIDEVYRKNGSQHVFLGADIKAVSDDVYTVNTFQKPANARSTIVNHTVLDVEIMTNANNERSFYCFDVIVFESRKVSNSPFKDGIKYFSEVDSLLKKHNIGCVKEFIKLSKTDSAKHSIRKHVIIISTVIFSNLKEPFMKTRRGRISLND